MPLPDNNYRAAWLVSCSIVLTEVFWVAVHSYFPGRQATIIKKLKHSARPCRHSGAPLAKWTAVGFERFAKRSF